MVKLLGFEITRKDDDLEKPAKAKQAFTIPSPDDGTTTISAAYSPSLKSFYGDFSGNHQGDVYSSVATGTVKLLDHATGIFFGDVSGGNIFNDDSSLLLSSDTSTLQVIM